MDGRIISLSSWSMMWQCEAYTWSCALGVPTGPAISMPNARIEVDRVPGIEGVGVSWNTMRC